jgi:hypothetical protein
MRIWLGAALGFVLVACGSRQSRERVVDVHAKDGAGEPVIRRDEGTAERAFVGIRHIGEQDKPIATLMIASSAQDLPPKARHEWVRTFVVSRSVMSSILGFVAGQAKNYAANEPPVLLSGTFEISWQSGFEPGRYVVFGAAACGYLREIRDLAKVEAASGLDDALRITLLRVECAAVVP